VAKRTKRASSLLKGEGGRRKRLGWFKSNQRRGLGGDAEGKRKRGLEKKDCKTRRESRFSRQQCLLGNPLRGEERN